MGDPAALRAARKNLSRARRLFTDDERKQLAGALAATNATAELLGRARIRRRLEQAERAHADHSDFSETATDFSCFDDKHPIHPLAPRAAVEWFRRLVPGLSAPSKTFADAHQRAAFTLAATTDEILLGRIKGILSRVLETGEGASKAPQLVGRILDEAGVSPRNPQYSENVVRTNLMASYNEGSTREMQHPDVRDAFPVWRWAGIRDGRQRHSHAVHFDKYFPNSVTFAEVRDSVKGSFDGYNDRCTPVPVYRKDWERLQAAGVRVSKYAETFAEDAEGHEHGKDGKFVPKGGGSGDGDSGDKDASRTPRQRYEAEVARIDAAHAAALEQYQKKHAAWEKAVEGIDAAHEQKRAAWEKAVADLDSKAEADYQQAYAAWEARADAREERKGAVAELSDGSHWDAASLDAMRKADVQDSLDTVRLLDTPEGRKEYQERAAQATELHAQAFAKGFGEKLPARMEQLGFPEKSVARVKDLAAKGEAAVRKMGTKYTAAVEKLLAAREKLDAWEAKEPQEPDAFDVPEDDPDYAAKEAAWDKAYAAWEEKHSSWEEKQEQLQEAMDEADTATSDWHTRMGEASDAFAEKIGGELESAAEKVAERIEAEQDKDVEPEQQEPEYPEEPEEPDADAYPEEPEEPDEPEYPDEPDEDEEEEEPAKSDAALHAELSRHAEDASPLPVPHVRQRPAACGPAALASVAKHFGVAVDQDALAAMLGTTEADGTPPQAMVAGCRLLGLSADASEGMSVEDLAEAVGRGSPVIVCLQAYGTPAEKAADEAGHWCVVVNVGSSTLDLIDPASDTPGGAVKLDLADFLRRWHDEAADGTEYRRFGIVVGRSEGHAI